ncbi:hypothetical protein Q7P35_002974 [Cladosporium inversicolor]
MSNTHNNTHDAHAHGHAHPTVELTKASQHTHDAHNSTQPYPVVQESSQYTHDNNTHKTTHPHPTVQPIEVSQYTYDAHKPSEHEHEHAATHDQTLRQHSVATPPHPTASRIHPVETEHPKAHKKHDSHSESKHFPEEHSEPQHKPESEHAHKSETQHAHKPEHHQSPSSPTSMIESDSVQVSPIFGHAERRQSWSKDEMKRGVMEGLLEKGKGKQAKGGYSSTS